ncbi:hypothetical protein Esti_002321 [Eimeria stiedai]
MRQQPSLSRGSSTDELLPKQQLPLPEGGACGAAKLSPAAAAAAAAEAAAAASAAARAATEGVSEEDEQLLLQQAAEAYLMSVHLEAQSLPLRVAAASVPTSSNKPAATVSDDAAASKTRGSLWKSSKNSGSSSSSARYIQQLLRLQSLQQQQHPPHPAWEAEALDFFKRIRVWLQQQRELRDYQQQQQQQQQQQPQQEEEEQPLQLYLHCVTWTADEWRLYCRTYPPTLPLLLQCDARCCCLLLQLLLEDLELQLQHEALAKRDCKDTEAPAAAVAPAAAAAEALAAAEAPVPASATAATTCCVVAGGPTSLPQLFWLFAALAALDEVEALRFEVSYALQRLRRRCLRLRGLVLRLLGCTGSWSAEEQEQQLRRLQKVVPFVAGTNTIGDGRESCDGAALTTGQHLQQQKGFKQNVRQLNQKQREARKLAEVALRQQLAALDVVLLIIRGFYGQK